MSQYNLWQRLTNANVTPMERDVITQALTVFKAPPPAHSPLPLIYHPAKQPLRLSPLPPAGKFECSYKKKLTVTLKYFVNNKILSFRMHRTKGFPTLHVPGTSSPSVNDSSFTFKY